MSLIADRLDEFDQLDAYKALRNARRKNRVTRVDVFDAFYKAYLLGIVGVVAIYGGASWLGQSKLNQHHLDILRTRGAAFAGLAVALAIAVGLRSGGRGGPLAFERPDVRHVLLAPIDKRNTIRQPALRTLRHNLFLGISFGGAAGIIGAGRLPHNLVVWVLVGALFGALIAAVGFGVAMIAGGLKLKRWLADLLAMVAIGWSAADAILKLKTSPMTWIGSSLTWPLKFSFLIIPGAVVAALAVLAGALVINRMSIESAERRSRLIGQLRFAATLQDVRTVMVIQRQLSQEHTRVRPWIRHKPTKRVGVRKGRVALGVYVRRGLAGYLRWPLVRYVRLLIFVSIAALSCVGIWGGTQALVAVAGIAMWLAGLDLIEGLAQEIDHPDLVDSMPRSSGTVYLSQLLTPWLVLFVLTLIAYGILCVFGDSNIVTRFSPVVLLASLCGVGGAAVAVAQRPALPTGTVDTPEIAGAKFIFKMLLPPAISIVGFLPVVAGERGWRAHHTVKAILDSQSPVVTAGIVFALYPILYLRYRDDFKKLLTTPAPPKKTDGDKAADKHADKRNANRKDTRPAASKNSTKTKSPTQNRSKKKGKR